MQMAVNPSVMDAINKINIMYDLCLSNWYQSIIFNHI